MTGDNPPAFTEPDFTRPAVSRVWDWWAGGHMNFDADRAVAAAVEAVCPQVRAVVAEARRFTGRAVTWAARQGVSQFADLGSGLLVRPAVHETAGEVMPGARVVYVDNDMVVAVHTRALLYGHEGATAVVEADLTDPDKVLGDPALNEVIDLAEPVCVLLCNVLHYSDPASARGLVAAYAKQLAPGSTVAVSVPRCDDPVLLGQLREAREPLRVELHNHSRADAESFLDGLELVPPGVVVARAWRGGMASAHLRPDGPVYVLAAAGRVAGTPGK